LTELLDYRNDARHFGQAQSGKQLIENHQVGLEGNGLREFQPLEITLWQDACALESHVRVALETDFLQIIQGYRVQIAIAAPGQPLDPRRVQRDYHVLISRELIEGLDHLESAGNPQPHDLIGRKTRYAAAPIDNLAS